MTGRGRSILVTGGGRGLGRAIAARLAADGARVGVLARTEAGREETVGEVRETWGEAMAIGADVLDLPSLKKGLARFAEWAGGLDALVCAAGRLKAVGPLAAADPDEWWRDLETSVRGLQNSLIAALPFLRNSAAGSVSVLVGPGHNGELPFAAGYGAGQAALVRLVESVAREWAVEKIPVYAVNPGLVATDLVRSLVDSAEGRRWLPQFNESLAEGKEVGPEVVAEMVSWLVENRPVELNGRVVAAPLTPTILETRLVRIREENLNILRLR